jgi:hypothetical protein
LEKYWNFASEDEFTQKLRSIFLDINPNIIIFSNENLLYKLDYIYHEMSNLQKNKFRINVFQNGLKPRVRLQIPKYY